MNKQHNTQIRANVTSSTDRSVSGGQTLIFDVRLYEWKWGRGALLTL